MNEILEVINEECNDGAGRRITKTMKIYMKNSLVYDPLEQQRQSKKRR
jgi:hypothetical protein